MNSEQKLYKSRQWLKKMYWDEMLTMQEIADLCGVTYLVIWRQLKKYGIKRRHRSFRAMPKSCGTTFFMSKEQRMTLELLAKKQSQKKSDILRDALFEYALKRGVNQFKEN